MKTRSRLPNHCYFAMAVLLGMGLLLTACKAPSATAVPPTALPPTSAPATKVPTVPPPTAVPTPRVLTERERTLATVYFDDITVVDPDVWYDVEGGSLMMNVYEGLVRYAPDSVTFEPALAQSWDVSADGKVYTFHLRKGVKFHDGTPFNAEAVKFNFERRLAVNQGPAYMLMDIDTAEAVDENTLKVTLKSPVAPFLHFLASMWGPRMISPTAVKAHTENDDWAQAWLKDHAVGTGPYTLESMERGQRYTLGRFADYWAGWQGNNHFDKVLIQIVKESATQRLLVEKGDLDLLTHGVPPTDAEAMAKNPALQTKRWPINQAAYVHMNCVRGPTADPYVREALAWAFNYKSLIEDLGRGFVLPLPSTYMAGFEGADQVTLPYKYDLDKAKEALSKSQYPQGGFKLEFTVIESEVEFAKKMAQVFQSDLQKLNITLEISQIPISVWWDLLGNPDKFPHLHWDDAVSDASDSYAWAYIVWHSKGFLNASFYNNPEVDKLLDEAPYVFDAKERAAIYKQVGEIVARENPAIFAAQLQDVMVARSDIEGFKHNPACPYVVDFHAMTRVVH